jgi:protein-L-isoaspartate(D-aspartate) O-methyltransferase
MPGPRDLAEAARQAGVRDERVLAAMAELPRAVFVPPHLARDAYGDRPIPISHRQVTTQPSLVARMVEALALRADDSVLEIGTGHGYQTALLARLAREVWSVELWEDLSDAASRSLAAAGIANAHLVVGDGTCGLPEQAPFQAILVSAAFPSVPVPLFEQLAPGGRLVQPIGPGGHDEVTVFAREETGRTSARPVTGAYFVPLYGVHGYPLDHAPSRP